MTADIKDRLLEAAKEAAESSYSPYSRFRVGAALLCRGGEVIKGTNVENRSYGLTNCAERSAIFTAVAMGIRDFEAIAIYSPDSASPLPPCGACRQVLTEFCGKELPVLMSGTAGLLEKSLGELYPLDSLHDLKGE